MHFYSTTAQIAKDLEIDHQIVVNSAINTPLSDEFKNANMLELNIPVPGMEVNVQMFQLTEPGYNATVFGLKLADIEDEETKKKIRHFREQMFMNKPPALTIPSIATTASTTPSTMPSGPSTGRSQVDENIRRQAEEKIASGQLDMLMAGTFADVWRKLCDDLGADAGYQNVRSYMIARRAQIGLTK